MRLSIVLLAVILFLFGLSHLGAFSIAGNIMGWLEIIDAALFLIEPVVPVLTIPLPSRTPRA